MKLSTALLIFAVGMFAATQKAAHAQSAPWKPDRPIELVVSCAPGCGPDNMARLMQRVFQEIGRAHV